MSAIETLFCRREVSLIGSTSFGFAQNMIRDPRQTPQKMIRFDDSMKLTLNDLSPLLKNK